MAASSAEVGQLVRDAAIMVGYTPSETMGMSSEQAKVLLTSQYSGLKSKLISIAFRHKSFIKQMPLIGKALLKKKNSMLADLLRGKSVPVIDVKPFLGYFQNDFIATIYRVLLGREADPEGFNNYADLMRRGLCPEGIVYLIAVSEEFANRAKISGLNEYKKLYLKFRRRQLFKNLPIIGRFISIFGIQGQINRLYARLERVEAVSDVHYNHIKRQVEQHNAVVNDLLLKIEELKKESLMIYEENLKEYVQQRKELIKELTKLKEEFFNEIMQQRIKLFNENKQQKKELSNEIKMQKAEILNELVLYHKNLLNEQDRLYEMISAKLFDVEELNKAIYSVADNGNILQSISEKADLNAAIATSISEKVDRLGANFSEEQVVPQELIIEGELHADSYLELARSDLSEEVESSFDDKDRFYFYLSNLFRGSEENIRELQKYYLPYVIKSYKKTGGLPFADIGCGRGEFLDLLRSANIDCFGVELNKRSAYIPLQKGHKVLLGDAIKVLESMEDESLSGVSMFQVAEHLTFDYMFEFCFLAGKKVFSGGCLLIETANPACYKNNVSFYVDPSHITHPSPESYKLLVEMSGFIDVKIRFYSPVQERTADGINSSLYRGYCLIAQKK